MNQQQGHSGKTNINQKINQNIYSKKKCYEYEGKQFYFELILDFDDVYFSSITKPDALIFDLKGTYRNSIKNRTYKSL